MDLIQLQTQTQTSNRTRTHTDSIEIDNPIDSPTFDQYREDYSYIQRNHAPRIQNLSNENNSFINRKSEPIRIDMKIESNETKNNENHSIINEKTDNFNNKNELNNNKMESNIQNSQVEVELDFEIEENDETDETDEMIESEEVNVDDIDQELLSRTHEQLITTHNYNNTRNNNHSNSLNHTNRLTTTHSVFEHTNMNLSLIEFDLPRTFPTLGFFHMNEPLHFSLELILQCYAYYKPDIGYVQGM